MSDLYGEIDEEFELDEDLRKWFGRKGAPGKKKGWVDCNTCRKDKKTGRKKCSACGRSDGEKRSKYPACRPTPSMQVGQKMKNEEIHMNLEQMVQEVKSRTIWLNVARLALKTGAILRKKIFK
jgi:hypothetical protein